MLLTKIAIKWKSSVFLMMIVITIFGSIAYSRLPREANPDIPIPYINITTVYSGVSPADIESLITFKIENKLRGIDGVKKITSYSAESVSNISIEFDPKVNTETALQRVRDKVEQASNELPADLTEEPLISEINISNYPVFVVAISGNVPEQELKKIADDMQDRFESIKGVLEVELSGARDREIHIIFDYERMQSYAISINDLSNAVKAEHINIPGGSIDIGMGKYLVRIPGEYNNPYDMEDIVIATRDNKPVYLRDVAKVIDTFEDKDSYAHLNREQAISVSIKKRNGANILDMAKDVKDVIKSAEEIYPPAIKFTLTTDQSKDIKDMVHELENHLATGLILVVLVLVFFLGKINSLFTAIAIPFTMLMSFIIIDALGMTLNMMVLFSLIMALGMLVDDAIVIVENIYRHMQEGKNRVDAAIAASEEVGWPVVASTLTKIFAFLPMAFWPGITGEFMKFLPITLMITLASSLFVALVFNPVICASFMQINPKDKHNPDNPERSRFMQIYIDIVNWCLDHRWTTISLSIFFMILPMFLFVKAGLGVEFFPDSDPVRVYIKANAPQGTAASATNDMILKIEEAAQDEPDIRLLLGEVGGAAADYADTGGTSTHRGRITIEFIDFEDRKEPSPVTIKRIRERIGSFAGAEVIWEQERMGPPTGDDVSIEISGKDVDVLGNIAKDIKEKIRNVSGLVDLKDDYVKSKPEIRIDVDREKAALLGLNTKDIANAVRGAVNGLETGKFRENDEEYDIKIRLPEDKRNSIEGIKNLMISADGGKYIPISTVAEVSLSAGFGTITRIDFKRVVNVTANAQGRSGIEVVKDVQKILSDYKTPAGYSISFKGETEEQEEASAFLGKAFMVAVFLILMVLMIEFNSVSQSFIILGTVLLSLGGVFWGLLITGTNFGIIMTGIGVISLAGVVVNNGIILIDYTNKLREAGWKMRDAVIHAGFVRFRPVMLTAWTAILGMIPMATGLGISVTTLSIETGAEMSQWWGPMANAVIFGLAFATMLTLVVVPVLYSFTGSGLEEDNKKPYNNIFKKIFKKNRNIKKELDYINKK